MPVSSEGFGQLYEIRLDVSCFEFSAVKLLGRALQSFVRGGDADSPAALSLISGKAWLNCRRGSFSLILPFNFGHLTHLCRLLQFNIPQTSLLLFTICRVCVCVCLQVISGSNLPSSRTGKTLDPFVRVEIYGIPSDSCRKSTHTDKNNGECQQQQQNGEKSWRTSGQVLAPPTTSLLVHFQ